MESALCAFPIPGFYFEVNIAVGESVTIREIVETAIAVNGFVGVDIQYDSTGLHSIPPLV